MSSQRLTVGMVALLETPVGDLHTLDWDNITEKLDAQGTNLYINYEGNVLILRQADKAVDYGSPGLQTVDFEKMKSDFEKAAYKAGLPFISGTEKIFVDYWYDGADSNHIDSIKSDWGYE